MATVGDALVGRLREWGVDHVFGYPGDGINGILGAMNRAADGPRFIRARHEEMSAFQATGYAKFTGRLGVCLATSGPGAIHVLNGLYIEWAQAKALVKSILSGDPAGRDIIRQSFRQKVAAAVRA